MPETECILYVFRSTLSSKQHRYITCSGLTSDSTTDYGPPKSVGRILQFSQDYCRTFISFIHSFISIQPQRPGWQEPQPSHVTGMALANCILAKFLGVVCHCFPPPLDVPTFNARYLYVRNEARDPSSERWNYGRENCPVILTKLRLPRKFGDLLHAVNLRHGTDGFTSPPKEGVLRIFSP